MSFLKHPKSKVFFKHAKYYFISESKKCPGVNFELEDFGYADNEKFFSQNNYDNESGLTIEMGIPFVFQCLSPIIIDENFGSTISEAPVYMCESDIKKIYRKPINENSKENDLLNRFNQYENLPILLPKISDLIVDLSNLISIIIKSGELENNDKIKEYAITYI